MIESLLLGEGIELELRTLVEVFVLGLDSLFVARLGAGALCSLPMLASSLSLYKQRKKWQSIASKIHPFLPQVVLVVECWEEEDDGEVGGGQEMGN